MHPTRPYTIGEDLELEADIGWRFCPRHGLARRRTKNNPFGCHRGFLRPQWQICGRKICPFPQFTANFITFHEKF